MFATLPPPTASTKCWTPPPVVKFARHCARSPSTLARYRNGCRALHAALAPASNPRRCASSGSPHAIRSRSLKALQCAAGSLRWPMPAARWQRLQRLKLASMHCGLLRKGCERRSNTTASSCHSVLRIRNRVMRCACCVRWSINPVSMRSSLQRPGSGWHLRLATPAHRRPARRSWRGGQQKLRPLRAWWWASVSSGTDH